MATQTRSPGTIAEGNIYGAGSRHWVNLANVGSSNNVYATVVATGTPGVYYAYTPICTNFGFTIPAGSTINSITVLIEAKVDHVFGDRIDWVSLMLGGVPTILHASCSNVADIAPDGPLTASDVIYSINPVSAGDGNLWGRAWSVANINDATFGCAFDVYLTGNLEAVDVDHVQITVDYTEEAPLEGICDTMPCNQGFKDFEQVIKDTIQKYTVDGCVGLRLYPVPIYDCDELTDLVDCGDKITFEEAFRAALLTDECGNQTLRVFVYVPAPR